MLRQQYEEDSLVSRVGMRIRQLRNEQGVSLRHFGMLAGVHPFHVMAIELGQLAANIRTLGAIAKALGVTPLDLLNHGDENDDMGHLVELMRKEPHYVQQIKRRVEPLVKTDKGKPPWKLLKPNRMQRQTPRVRRGRSGPSQISPKNCAS